MSSVLSRNGHLVRVSGLHHKYGERPVLSMDTWRLMPFEHQLLLGPSGSGKTTLLGILSGLLRPTSGSVEVLDVMLTDISVGNLSSFRARNFGFVFQDHHLVSSLTVIENLQLALNLAGLPDDPTWTGYLLSELGLKTYQNSKPDKLSHGEAQRAAIARAAVTKPPLLLADEPTSSLDDDNAYRVMELLKMLSEEAGATMLVASHDYRLKPFFSHSLILDKPKEEER